MIEYKNLSSTAVFRAEVIPEDYEGELTTYCYPGAMKDAWVPGVTVLITPASSSQWVGHFLRGKESPECRHTVLLSSRW